MDLGPHASFRHAADQPSHESGIGRHMLEVALPLDWRHCFHMSLFKLYQHFTKPCSSREGDHAVWVSVTDVFFSFI